MGSGCIRYAHPLQSLRAFIWDLVWVKSVYEPLTGTMTHEYTTEYPELPYIQSGYLDIDRFPRGILQFNKFRNARVESPFGQCTVTILYWTDLWQ